MMRAFIAATAANNGRQGFSPQTDIDDKSQQVCERNTFIKTNIYEKPQGVVADPTCVEIRSLDQ